MIEKANSVLDQAERTKFLRRAQEIAWEDAATFLIANSVTITPLRKEVVDYKPHTFGGQPFYGVGLKK